MVFTTPLTKRGDLEIPTKSALLFFVRGKKRKNFSYFFLLCEKTVFTTPLTRNTLSTNIPLTSLTLTFRIPVTRSGAGVDLPSVGRQDMSDQEDTTEAARGDSNSRGTRVRRDGDRGRPWN